MVVDGDGVGVGVGQQGCELRRSLTWKEEWQDFVEVMTVNRTGLIVKEDDNNG